MAKYYVQCGLSRQLVQAEDAQGAALWGVHQIIDGAVDLDAIDWSDPAEIENLDLLRVMLALGDTVEVSEIGWGAARPGSSRRRT